MREDVLVTRGGDVLLSGLAVLEVTSALELVGLEMRRNGGGSSQRVASLVEVFTVAARRLRSFEIETAKPLLDADVSASAMADPIGSEVAVEMLGCTAQNFTKHCRRGSFETARKVGAQWMVERADVLAWMERMAS